MRKTIVTIALLLTAAVAHAKTYRGTSSTSMTVKLTNKTHNLERAGTSALSFAVSRGQLHVEMVRPKGEKWSQAFLVKSDRAANGVRQIVFERPAPSSPLAKQNRRALNGKWWMRILGGYKSLEGGGVLSIIGGGISFFNKGTGRVRLGFVTRDVSWDESFHGTRTGE